MDDSTNRVFKWSNKRCINTKKWSKIDFFSLQIHNLFQKLHEPTNLKKTDEQYQKLKTSVDHVWTPMVPSDYGAMKGHRP